MAITATYVNACYRQALKTQQACKSAGCDCQAADAPVVAWGKALAALVASQN